jgi:hypothetical protein
VLDRYADEAFIDESDAIKVFTDLTEAHWAYYIITEATNGHTFERTEDFGENWLTLK